MNIIAIARNATMQAEESECFIIADDIHYSGFAIRYSRYASRQMSNSILDFPSIHGMEVPSALNI